LRNTTITVPLKGVVSRKVHGSAGTFDVDLTNGHGIECRSGDANNVHTLVFTFVNPLTSVDSVSASATSPSGPQPISSSGAIGPDAHQYVVKLSGVPNAQYVTATLSGVHDNLGNASAAIPVTMGVLLGDSTADRFVNSADVSQVKSQSGVAVTSSNFREDLNADGFINSADISLAKSKSGTALPASP
jgi:hypothetical protein